MNLAATGSHRLLQHNVAAESSANDAIDALFTIGAAGDWATRPMGPR